MLTGIVCLLVLVFVPGTVSAQSASAPMPRWDAAGTVGFFAAYRPRTDGETGYQDDWLHVAQGGAVVGHYLNRHFKIEAEATATNDGTQFRERRVNLPGLPYPVSIGSHVTTSVNSVAALLTWQFRDNEWVHPFVQAGVAADFERTTVRTWEQFSFGQPGIPPQRVVEERVDGPATDRELRAVVGGGAKLYVSERAFVRTDARWSLWRDRHNIAMRAGFGIDF